MKSMDGMNDVRWNAPLDEQFYKPCVQVRRRARDAQYDAIVEWGIPDHGALQRLTGIGSPTPVIQDDADQMIPTRLSQLCRRGRRGRAAPRDGRGAAARGVQGLTDR